MSEKSMSEAIREEVAAEATEREAKLARELAVSSVVGPRAGRPGPAESARRRARSKAAKRSRARNRR